MTDLREGPGLPFFLGKKRDRRRKKSGQVKQIKSPSPLSSRCVSATGHVMTCDQLVFGAGWWRNGEKRRRLACNIDLDESECESSKSLCLPAIPFGQEILILTIITNRTPALKHKTSRCRKKNDWKCNQTICSKNYHTHWKTHDFRGKWTLIFEEFLLKTNRRRFVALLKITKEKTAVHSARYWDVQHPCPAHRMKTLLRPRRFSKHGFPLFDLLTLPVVDCLISFR